MRIATSEIVFIVGLGVVVVFFTIVHDRIPVAHEKALVIGLGVLVGGGLLVALTWGSLLLRANKKIVEQGVPLQALILEVHDRGHGSSGAFVELYLEVRPKEGSPYRTRSYLNIGVLDPSLVFRPGMLIEVFANPKDPNDVVVPPPFLGPPSGSGPSAPKQAP